MQKTIELKNISPLKSGIIAVAVVLVIAGIWFYTATMGTVLIDNPTDKDIVVNINNTDYNLAARSYEKITLPFGSAEYKVLTDNQEVGIFKKGMFDGSVLINPTLSTYVKQTVYYGTEYYMKDAEADGKVKDVTVCIDGKEYIGYNLVTYKDLYIKKDWNYGIDTVSPDTMQMKQSDNYALTDELFRGGQFTNDNSPQGDC